MSTRVVHFIPSMYPYDSLVSETGADVMSTILFFRYLDAMCPILWHQKHQIFVLDIHVELPLICLLILIVFSKTIRPMTFVTGDIAMMINSLFGLLLVFADCVVAMMSLQILFHPS